MFPDVARAVTIFALGTAVTLEVGRIRFMHVAILTPDGLVYHVPLSAKAFTAFSRIVAIVFIALELHERAGTPASWRVFFGAVIAVTSLVGSILVIRSRIDTGVEVKSSSHTRR